MAIISKKPLQVVFNERSRGYDHKFGGYPRKFSRDSVPKCKACKHPLHLLLQVDAIDPLVGFGMKDVPYLFVMTCLNCDANWEPNFYRVTWAPPSIELLYQEEGISFAEDGWPGVLDEKPVLIKELRKKWNPEELAKHQLGGKPLWIQGEQNPDCIKCKKPMEFIAQIDTDDDVEIMFGDTGSLYAFYCPGCSVYATFMQCF